jgi:hypothetical protein
MERGGTTSSVEPLVILASLFIRDRRFVISRLTAFAAMDESCRKRNGCRKKNVARRRVMREKQRKGTGGREGGRADQTYSEKVELGCNGGWLGRLPRLLEGVKRHRGR